jgi:hypothetical protein
MIFGMKVMPIRFTLLYHSFSNVNFNLSEIVLGKDGVMRLGINMPEREVISPKTLCFKAV